MASGKNRQVDAQRRGLEVVACLLKQGRFGRRADRHPWIYRPGLMLRDAWRELRVFTGSQCRYAHQGLWLEHGQVAMCFDIEGDQRVTNLEIKLNAAQPKKLFADEDHAALRALRANALVRLRHAPRGVALSHMHLVSAKSSRRFWFEGGRVTHVTVFHPLNGYEPSEGVRIVGDARRGTPNDARGRAELVRQILRGQFGPLVAGVSPDDPAVFGDVRPKVWKRGYHPQASERQYGPLRTDWKRDADGKLLAWWLCLQREDRDQVPGPLQAVYRLARSLVPDDFLVAGAPLMGARVESMWIDGPSFHGRIEFGKGGLSELCIYCFPSAQSHLYWRGRTTSEGSAES